MNGVLLTGIPVPRLVEVEVAHVVALYLTQPFATLEHLTPAVVLLRKRVTIVFVGGSEVVGVVSEGNRASELVSDGAHEQA